MTNTSPNVDSRSPEQVAHELSMGEVSDVLTNLDFAIGRAKKALTKLRKSGVQTNVIEPLEDALAEMQATRKRLVQGTYYAGTDTRLL